MNYFTISLRGADNVLLEIRADYTNIIVDGNKVGSILTTIIWDKLKDLIADIDPEVFHGYTSEYLRRKLEAQAARAGTIFFNSLKDYLK